MKRWVFIFAMVHMLAASFSRAQAGKDGPMAKLTYGLILLHAQHTAPLAQRSAAQFGSNDPLVLYLWGG